MNKKQKLTLALVVTGGLIFAGKKIYEWSMDNFREYTKRVENRAVEKNCRFVCYGGSNVSSAYD